MTEVVKAISHLPLPYEIKTKLIRATPLAAAKYGTPAAHVGNASYVAFRAALVGAIAPKTTKRRPCRTFEFNSHGDDLDPEVVFGIENVLLRRVRAKDPELGRSISDFSIYIGSSVLFEFKMKIQRGTCGNPRIPSLDR